MGHGLIRNSVTGKFDAMIRKGAWHHLGNVVQEAQTAEATIIEAGMDHLISKRQLQINGIDIPAWALFRDDIFYHDPAAAHIVNTTEGFQVIQNRFMFSYLDSLVEGEGKAHYESAGILNNGKQVWALINLGVSFEIGANGDRFENYLCFTEDRTGQRAAQCFTTSIRVVCANTFEQAYGRADGKAVKFYHRGDMAQRMIDAADLFTGVTQDVKLLEEKLNILSRRSLNKEMLGSVLDELFPPVKDETDRQLANREKKQINILELFTDNDGNMFPETKGTAYNLFNAVTNYVDHEAPVKVTEGRIGRTDKQIRAENAMFGDGAKFKGSALDLILAKTEGAATRTVTYIDLKGQEIQVEERTLDNSSLLDAVLEQGVNA